MFLKLIKPNEELLGFMLRAEVMFDEEWADFIRLLPRALKKGEGSIEVEKNTIKVMKNENWWKIFEINEDDAEIIKRHIESKKMLWIRRGGYPISIEFTFEKRFENYELCELKTTN